MTTKLEYFLKEKREREWTLNHIFLLKWKDASAMARGACLLHIPLSLMNKLNGTVRCFQIVKVTRLNKKAQVQQHFFNKLLSSQYLTYNLIDTPFDAIANRADSDKAALVRALVRAAWSRSSLFLYEI